MHTAGSGGSSSSSSSSSSSEGEGDIGALAATTAGVWGIGGGKGGGPGRGEAAAGGMAPGSRHTMGFSCAPPRPLCSQDQMGRRVCESLALSARTGAGGLKVLGLYFNSCVHAFVRTCGKMCVIDF